MNDSETARLSAQIEQAQHEVDQGLTDLEQRVLATLEQCAAWGLCGPINPGKKPAQKSCAPRPSGLMPSPPHPASTFAG